jgi:hypothetical protein
MALPLEETTPVTEAIESWSQRIVDSLLVLTPLAERAVSDATRSLTPDTSPGTTAYNAARFWTALAQQAALTTEALASVLVLLGYKTEPRFVVTSATPVVFDYTDAVPAGSLPADATYELRLREVKASNGDIRSADAAFVLAGEQIPRGTPSHPVLFSGGQPDGVDLFLQVAVTEGSDATIATGPISGLVDLVPVGTAAPVATSTLYASVE